MFQALRIYVVFTSCLATQASTGANGPASTTGGIFTPAQAGLGEREYAVSCAVCHGPDLAGGEHAPSLAGDAFLRRWQGRSVGDLFRRIRTSMPQQSPGSLSNKAFVEIVSFIVQANGYPAGVADLTTEPTELDKIRIDPGTAGN
jgi:S-disulfanyl-L-cysteine oxidoreductase SoxD